MLHYSTNSGVSKELVQWGLKSTISPLNQTTKNGDLILSFNHRKKIHLTNLT